MAGLVMLQQALAPEFYPTTEGVNTVSTIFNDKSGSILDLIFSATSVSGYPLGMSRRITPTAQAIQGKLRQKFQAQLSRLTEQDELNNPVARIAEIIDEIPIDDATWREIIEEPYG